MALSSIFDPARNVFISKDVIAHGVLELRSKNLFKRCQQCASVITAQCPTCKSEEVCTLTAQSCDECPHYECQKQTEAGQIAAGTNSSHKSPAPAIAGGVVGGIILIAAVVFIVWKYILKGSRHDPVEEWDPMDYPMEKPGSGDIAIMPRDARSRASTHTVTSMASTVLTRASNIIQIAYIPGVTNRQANQTQGSPGLLVPPVPPIPIPTTPSTNGGADEQHFFLPGDLRGSTYSDATSLGDARQSIAPSLARTSIASTVMGGSAVPTSVTKLKPSLVSVRSGGSSATSPALSTPPVPTIDVKRFHNDERVIKPVLVQIPSSSERGNASPASSFGGLKPTALTITKGKIKAAAQAASSSGSSAAGASLDSSKHKATGLGLRSSKISSIAESHTSTESPHARAKHQLHEDSSDEDDDAHHHDRSRRSLLGKSESPFSDSAAEDTPDELRKSPTTKSGEGKSPFDDGNAV